MTTAGDSAESSKTQLDVFQRAATKVRSKFPSAPGVYLFQDQAGRVIYIGKAKDLRARVVTYFLQAAAQDRRTAQLVREAYDVDFIEAESEVDAMKDTAAAALAIGPPRDSHCAASHILSVVPQAPEGVCVCVVAVG